MQITDVYIPVRANRIIPMRRGLPFGVLGLFFQFDPVEFATIAAQLLHRARHRDPGSASSRANPALGGIYRVMAINSSDIDRVQDQSNGRPAVSRVSAFAELARRRTAGEMVLLPRMLTGNDRRIHVRQTIREDHATRIATHNEEAREKFEKLAGSVFRSSAALRCCSTATGRRGPFNADGAGRR